VVSRFKSTACCNFDPDCLAHGDEPVRPPWSQRAEELGPWRFRVSPHFRTLVDQPDVLIVDRIWYTGHYFLHEPDCLKVFFTIQVTDDFFKLP
jgi:hypothetical protein